MPWLRSLLAVALTSSLAFAGDWPQWLGPNRDGASKEVVPPWKEAPQRVWSAPAGDGHSAPIVAGGRVFIFSKGKDNEEEQLLALDAAKGTKLWSTSYPRGKFENQFGNGPRSTPAVAGGKVYTFGATGFLTCFDVENGKQIWQVDTLTKFKVKNLTFGVSCSPLVDGDRVVVDVGKDASVVAFDRLKGDVVWKGLDDAASYSSPVIFTKGKERQLVTLTQEGVVSLDPADGKLFWKFPLRDLLQESSTTPIRIGDVVLASSVTFGSVGLKLDQKDGKPTGEMLWKNGSLTCYFATPVAVGKDHVYMVTGSLLARQATLRCVETATGKELWSRPKVGRFHASLLRTGDDKLLMLEEAGSLVLVDPNPKEYRELARAKVCGMTWAHPTLADGKLYVRDAGTVSCWRLVP